MKTVFFDAAGTLFDARRAVGESYAAVAREFGAQVSGAQINAQFRRVFADTPGLAFGPHLAADRISQLEREWWRTLVARTFTELWQFEDFDAYFDALFSFFGDPANWVAYPEAFEVLETLKRRGLQLGIISNFDGRLYKLLAGLDLLSFFDSVTISSEAGFAKPHPAIFGVALAKHDHDPGQALHVGDSFRLDVQGASAVGIATILVQREGHVVDRSAASPPAQAINSLVQVLPLVERRLAEHGKGVLKV